MQKSLDFGPESVFHFLDFIGFDTFALLLTFLIEDIKNADYGSDGNQNIYDRCPRYRNSRTWHCTHSVHNCWKKLNILLIPLERSLILFLYILHSILL